MPAPSSALRRAPCFFVNSTTCTNTVRKGPRGVPVQDFLAFFVVSYACLPLNLPSASSRSLLHMDGRITRGCPARLTPDYRDLWPPAGATARRGTRAGQESRGSARFKVLGGRNSRKVTSAARPRTRSGRRLWRHAAGQRGLLTAPVLLDHDP